MNSLSKAVKKKNNHPGFPSPSDHNSSPDFSSLSDLISPTSTLNPSFRPHSSSSSSWKMPAPPQAFYICFSFYLECSSNQVRGSELWLPIGIT